MHPRYVHQVLRDRGFPVKSLAAVEAFVQSLDPGQVEDMGERVRRLALGVEREDDGETLLAAINAATLRAAPKPQQSPTVAPQQVEPAGSDALAPPATAASEPLARSGPVHAAVRSAPVPKSSPSQEVLEVLRQHGMHVYATSAALKIELGTLREGHADGSSQYTVQLDAARARAGGGYDWTAKIPFQFTRRELPLLAAALLGFRTEPLKIGNHGPNADKHFELVDQKAHLYVKVRAGGAPIGVPVGPADVFAWGELCLVALQLNRPAVGTEGHLALLRRIGKMGAQDV